MGLFSKRRRKKLMRELLEEGRLVTYRKRIKVYMKNMDEKEKALVKKAKTAQGKDASQAKLLIQQIQEVTGLKNRVFRLESYLDNFANKQETQEVYEDFLNYLADAKKLSHKAPSKRKGRRTLSRSGSQIKDLNHLFDYIDKKLAKFDRHELSGSLESSKSLDAVDVDAFLSQYE